MALRTHDLPFPAVVTAPDGKQWTIARLWVTDDGQVVVFGFGDGRVREEGRSEVTSYQLPGRSTPPGETPTWSWVDEHGGTWFATKGNGCGCGHPLKRANLAAILARS